MKIKKIISGAMAVIMAMSLTGTSVSALSETDYSALVQRLEKTTYDGDDLGAVYSKEGTAFKVWAPSAQSVTLNLYTTGSDSEKNAKTISNTPMNKDNVTGVWSVKVDGDLNGTYYTYTVTTDGESQETGDIYAKAAGVNGERSMVVDLSSTNPSDWDKDNRILFDEQTQAIVWEIHVKDFSNSETSGVSEENRGKYLAFTETGTTLNGKGDIPTCIDYLKQLGVTAVQINPFYDYGSVDETVTDDEELFNWGYDPKNYNVPEGSYSSNPYDGAVRINETKQMIKALHDAGIAVIMDVVYNHTYTGEDSFFNRTVPGYYYRFTQDGQWSNASGCGNDTASEHTMYRKFMVDSVYYWATEYHLDGFRFDLMGLHDVDTMNAIREKLDTIENGEKIVMYGEGWEMAQNTESSMASQSNMKLLSERIGAFNDGIRDALKGDNFNANDSGFVQGNAAPSKVKRGVQAATVDWAKQPSQTVTYASAHDNLTLYDKLISSAGEKGADYTKRYEDLVAMNKLSAGVVLTSQGISFMLAGEEMARTKQGDENSYKSSALINQLDWSNLEKFPDLTAYYAGLMQIRNNFAPFTCSSNEAIDNMFFFENGDKRALSYMLTNTLTADSQWSAVVCIFNSNNDKDITVELEGEAKNKNWVIVANSEKAGLTSLGEVTDGRVDVKKTGLVILAEKESFEKAALKADNSLIEKLSSISVTQTGKVEEPPTDEPYSQLQTENGNPSGFAGIAIAAGAGILVLAGAAILAIKKNKNKNKQN